MKTVTIALIVCTLTLSSIAQNSQSTKGQDLFGEPESLHTAGKPFKGIMYPSPVLQDLDGDGAPELIVGDLPGRMRVAKRAAEGGDTAWAALKPMKLADGSRIDLNNW